MYHLYHKSNDGDLCNRAFACISDHMTHDTVAIYVFVEKLINENPLIQWRIMCPIQKLHKLCKSNFSCTRSWYYSRVELLCNFPQEEFIWQSWRDCQTYLATRASLQRPLNNQILTPYQLFEFARQGISGSMLTWRLPKRLQLSLNHNLQRLNVSKVPGTITSLFQKGVAWGWLIFLGVPPMLTTISLIPTEMDLNNIKPGSYYACKYDNDLYFCVVNCFHGTQWH